VFLSAKTPTKNTYRLLLQCRYVSRNTTEALGVRRHVNMIRGVAGLWG